MGFDVAFSSGGNQSSGWDPCYNFYDTTEKAGHCDKPNKCADDSYDGKWSIYAIPCDGNDKDLLYNMDPGWGGAHITMTSFQDMNEDDAVKAFNNLKNSLHPTHPYNWQPLTFAADAKKDGTRRIDITSNNLDVMQGHFKKAGWNSPTNKGNWHVTMADLTKKDFKKGDDTYNHRTYIFSHTEWAVVLVQAYKDQYGNLMFHRRNGYHLQEWATHSQEPAVVV